MHAGSWPADATISSPNMPSLSSIINRLQALFHSHLEHEIGSPTVETQTHLLHLKGAILPHVDNIDASGSMIMGVSLGAPRVLRMTRRTEGLRDSDTLRDFQALLIPGSVYIQRLVSQSIRRSHWRNNIFLSGMRSDTPSTIRSLSRTSFEARLFLGDKDSVL